MARPPDPIGSLTVRYDDLTTREIPVQAPGAAIRFSLGAPSAHATVWRLWTSPRSADLYLSVRDNRDGGGAKYSFHAFDDWRLQQSSPAG